MSERGTISSSWPNTFVWFFTPNHKQLQRFHMAGFMGESHPLQMWLTAGAGQRLDRAAVRHSGPLAGHALRQSCTPSPGASIWKSPCWETRRHFSSLWLNLPSSPSSLSPHLARSIKLQESLFLGESPSSEMTPLSVWIQLTLNLWTSPGQVSARANFRL